LVNLPTRQKVRS